MDQPQQKLTKWEITTRVFEVIGTLSAIAAVIGIYLAYGQFKDMNAQTTIQSQTLEETRKVDSEQFIYNINKDVNSSEYDSISIAIDDNKSTWPILLPKGRFTTDDIDNYVGNFDDVGNLYNDQLIEPNMAYDDFSDEVESAWCNKDVQSYVLGLQKQAGIFTGGKAYYWGFESLANTFLKIDGKNDCVGIDNEP